MLTRMKSVMEEAKVDGIMEGANEAFCKYVHIE